MQTSTTDQRITTETPASGYKYSYQQILFHTNAYLKCQPRQPDISFWVCNHKKSLIQGVMHFHFIGVKAISQGYAPFGSYDGIVQPDPLKNQLVSEVLMTLVKKGIREIEIIAPSPIYHGGADWGAIFRSHGFVEERAVNKHIVVDTCSFRDKLHQMEKRKLAGSPSLRFKTHSQQYLQVIYNFIERCRRERDQSLSMSYQHLKTVVQEFPDKFLLCTASLEGVYAAASIVIKVTSSCWYQFYPGHLIAFNKQSPLVYLLSKLYQKAKEEGVDYIDLGTSELQGKPLEGLLKFKERVGGISTSKSRFLWNIR